MESLTKPGAHSFSEANWQMSSRDPPYSSSQSTVVTNSHFCSWPGIYVGTGDQTQVIMSVC